MKGKASKNNPDTKGKKVVGKMVTSDDCLKCKHQCRKGLDYLKKFEIKRVGNGVWCNS